MIIKTRSKRWNFLFRQRFQAFVTVLSPNKNKRKLLKSTALVQKLQNRNFMAHDGFCISVLLVKPLSPDFLRLVVVIFCW